MFDGRLPASYADRAPQLVTRDDGTNAWVYEGQESTNVALNAVAGRPPDEYGMEPTSFAQFRAGCYDVDERVKDMDANGVLGSLCFPSFPQFCGQLFARTEDKAVALAMVRAYNDWHIEEWCGTHPGRFIPCSLPAIWDPEDPHSDSTWPCSPERLAEHLDGVGDEDVDRISHQNAMRHFQYDPFSALGGREQCTVGALRKRAIGHDVAIRSVKATAVTRPAPWATDLAVPDIR
jgi:hypothetical protein